jgi:hypothetical protein
MIEKILKAYKSGIITITELTLLLNIRRRSENLHVVKINDDSFQVWTSDNNIVLIADKQECDRFVSQHRELIERIQKLYGEKID